MKHKSKWLLIAAIFSMVGAALAVSPDFYIERPSPAMETGQVSPETAIKKFKLSVETKINGLAEEAKVAVYRIDASGKRPSKIKEFNSGKSIVLENDKTYKIEAFFPRVNRTVSKKIMQLSRNLKIVFNLEYYNLKVASLRNNASDLGAAADLTVYERANQSRPIVAAHTDGYVPVNFFLEGKKSYVIMIKYDNGTIANTNGQVVYDLLKDDSITFNYDSGL